MNKPPSSQEIKEIAKHLRKPTGSKGIEIAKMMNDGNLPMNLHTLAVLNPQPKQHILEIGMANGFFVKNILTLNNSILYTGIDYAETLVQEAIKINEQYIKNRQANFTQGNIENLPFKDQLFDSIFTINTFYFWENTHTAMQEVYRVLQPNGKFILSIRPKHNLEQYPVTKYNFKLIETSEIIAKLRQHGFKTIHQTTIKEPEQERWGKIFQRECVILECYK